MILDKRSIDLRNLLMLAIEGTKKGHVGGALSIIEILRVLYDDVMNYRVNDPQWQDRDRFILSKGHGCLALYAMLADKGFISTDELKTYALQGSRLGGHPERSKVPGIEASTGALGHGLSFGVGMALGLRIKRKNCKVFVLLGDGELNEGSVWEAVLSASHHKLSNLTALVDRNGLQLCGPTCDIANLDPLREKFESFGFAVKEVDGHDVNEMKKLLKKVPFNKDKPSIIICDTVKGKGISFMENDFQWHWKAGINEDTIAQMKKELGCVK